MDNPSVPGKGSAQPGGQYRIRMRMASACFAVSGVLMLATILPGVQGTGLSLIMYLVAIVSFTIAGLLSWSTMPRRRRRQR